MLLTKLHIPHAGNNIVHRSVLYEKLNIGLSRKLILVSAPAGFGKTTVVSDWINQNKISAAWFSIDKADNDPVEFLSYIISGIQSIQKGFGESALKLLHSPNKQSGESIASLLINEVLDISLNFILVLDDFHLINSNEVLKLLTYFLEHIPGNIHIVILTRSDPALSLSRLRSQHQLVELRSSDLIFSANDISVLFNKKLKLGLSIDDVYALETKTEGWIAGLQLTALSMHGRENISEFIQDLKGDNRYIMDYLMEEVLKIQTDDIKDFLLQTSILEQMSAPLCNEVLNRNDSQLILETLEKNNMFVIHLDEERNWYRYHHLFADLLKQRLQLLEKEDIIGLHNKACCWFEQHNMIDFAIGHALAIKNHEKSIQLIGEVVEEMWETGEHSAILRYGNLLPVELIRKNPEFCLYYSWILITTGQIEEAEPFLGSAEKITTKLINDKLSSKEEIRKNKILLGKLSTAMAYMKLFSAPAEKIINYGKIAIENLSEENHLWIGWAWYSIGNAEMSRGNLEESRKALENALKHSRRSGNLYLISTITTTIATRKLTIGQYNSAYEQCSDLLSFMKDRGYSRLSETEWTYSGLFTIMSVIQCIWTDFDEALENVKIAYDLCKNEKNIRHKIMAVLAYSYILHAHEDKTGAFDKINELEDVLRQYKISPFLASTYIGWKIYLLIDMGQTNKANDFAKEMGLGLKEKITSEHLLSHIFYIRLMLVQYKFDEAELLLSELYAIADQAKGIEWLVQLKILYAVMYKMRDEHEKAIVNFIEAVELAAGENLLIYFLFDLNITNDLLNDIYRIQASENTKIPDKFINNLKRVIETKKNRLKNRAESELSARELDTLKLIAENLMNQEIADKLFISVNTVKTHLKNINLKLGVESRVEAVTKAKELRLI
jgi:LuxR family maltose regulon positive regulatory protein